MKENNLKIITLCTGLFALIGCLILFFIKLDFYQNCSGRLERAANANTVEIAISELNAAINYVENHDYTNGYTSVIYKTPDEDVEYWYNNIYASREELMNLPDSTTTLEKTNALMKLRETLTDNDEGKTIVVYPSGLAFYPHNLLWGIFKTIVIISLIIHFILIIAYIQDKI